MREETGLLFVGLAVVFVPWEMILLGGGTEFARYRQSLAIFKMLRLTAMNQVQGEGMNAP